MAEPRLSVVIASSNPGALLSQCLAALVADADPATTELVVVRDVARAVDLDARDAWRRAGVRWIDAPVGCTIPRLRALGIEAARGGIVGLLEDDCVVQPGWCRAAIAAHAQADDVAIGGAVEPGAYATPLDWAVYFCEYGRFMLPVPAGPHPPLPGNNVTYKRPALVAAVDPDGFQEVFVHEAWRRAGLATRATPALVVENVNAWSLRHVTVVPYHHGRGYAARRFGGRPAAVRALAGVLALGLPVLKTVRVIRLTVSRRRLVGRLAAALPWVVLFTASWSIGETAGAWCGPGASPSRWR